MKVKITLALAAVALTTAVQMAVAAERAKLPTAMLGHWCGETDDLGSITLKRKKCPNSDGFLIMKADGYRSHETDCKTLNTVFLRRAGTVPDTYIVDYQCAGPKVRLGKKDALCFLAASISE